MEVVYLYHGMLVSELSAGICSCHAVIECADACPFLGAAAAAVSPSSSQLSAIEELSCNI
jgi:succinate dehydrogenase/fumarate reductase-like Fe-S protein